MSSSRHHPSGHRPWRPPETHAPEQAKEDSGGGKDEEGGDDELDALLDGYAAQAAADTARVLNRTHKPAPGLKGMVQARQAGLATALPPENRGFQLLKRMGYQEGAGLGLASRQGAAEPLGINLKAGRSGLGVDEQRKRQRLADEAATHAEAADKRRRDAGHQVVFQDTRRSGFAQRRTLGQLHAAWKTCQVLEERCGRSEADQAELLAQLPALHPQAAAPAAAAAGGAMDVDDEAGIEAGPASRADDEGYWAEEDTGPRPVPTARGGRHAREQLEEDELEAAGLTAGGTGGGTRGRAAGGTREGLHGDESGEEVVEVPLARQLDVLLSHLRESHLYCLYCGCAYDSPDDMRGNCPGPLEEDH